MARINVEDGLFKDIRFINLCIRLGDADRALGALIRAWCLAQKYYLNGAGLIPKEKWIEQGIKNEIIEVGLAEESEATVKVRGCDEQFAWLKQRSEAGKIGGKRRVDNLLASSRSLDGRLTDDYPKPSRGQASISSSPSSSSSFSSSISNSKELKNKKYGDEQNSAPAESPSPKKPNPTFETWLSYAKAYEQRWGCEPPKNDRSLALCKQLNQRLGVGVGRDVASYFLTHTDAIYIRAKHPLNLLVRDCEKIFTDMKTGNVLTGVEARTSEIHSATVRGIQDYYKKKHEKG